MDKLLNIVPYISKHGKIILASQMNHVLMDKDAQFDGDAMDSAQREGFGSQLAHHGVVAGATVNAVVPQS